MQNIKNALLQAVNLGTDRLDAEWLLLHTLGLGSDSRAWLRAHDTDSLSPEHLAVFNRLCQRRLDQEPVAYITGQRGFYGLQLLVDARVLDPRPDTETLVDWALDALQGTNCPKVADLGTGSGAIALAIQHQRPDAHVLAVDASIDALAVAQANAKRLNLGVQFAQGSWLEPMARMAPSAGNHEGWNLIVSNPPYIAEGDHHLPALKHEPRQALTSGPDGLDDICIIVADAPQHLAPDGWLLLEHGYNQASAVKALMQERGFADVQSRNDLAGVTRCTGGRWRSAHKAG
jgi:release factor glutamine methyltransferase